MTDQELKDLVASLAVAQAKTDALLKENAEQQKKTDDQMRKTDEQMRKTDAKLERIGIRLGNMSDNMGMSTEDYFYNSMLDNPVLGNIRFDMLKKNIHTKTKRLEDEYDVVLYNGDSIGLVECKYKAHENDLRRLIGKKVASFRELFPDYRDFKIYLGLASFSFYPELEEMAKQNGVAILKQKGDVVQVDADYLKAY